MGRITRAMLYEDMLSPSAVAALKEKGGVACSQDTVLRAIDLGDLEAVRIMGPAHVTGKTMDTGKRKKKDKAISALGIRRGDAEEWLPRRASAAREKANA